MLRVYAPDECGKDGYPSAWHKGEPAIKDLIRELAGHRCVRCCHPFRVGKTKPEWSPCDNICRHDGPMRGWSEYGDPVSEKTEAANLLDLLRCGDLSLVEAAWRVLTVHHLTGEKADCRWWNLAALCQRCHLQIQGRVRMEQVYPHEHSDWFKPYAAGYYAATYLGEDLTRQETEARLDSLLALERTPQPEAA